MIKGQNQLRKQGYVKTSDADMPDYPLSNIKSTEGLPTKFVKKKKISTTFEMNKLQEKYENPEEKKGKKRSHKGYLNYGQKLNA